MAIDHGTGSVRALLADVATGTQIATAVFYHPRWIQGHFCDPEQSASAGLCGRPRIGRETRMLQRAGFDAEYFPKPENTRQSDEL